MGEKPANQIPVAVELRRGVCLSHHDGNITTGPLLTTGATRLVWIPHVLTPSFTIGWSGGPRGATTW